LGLWIDLTFTDRYFNKSEIQSRGTEYYKLKIGGHGVEPSPSNVKTFINVCRDFLNRNPEQLIGVHCTHGFNRTGYLIVAFLVQNSKYKVHDAISEFRNLRPNGIYRQNYVDILIRRYGSSSGDEVPPVIDPPWKEGSSRGQKRPRVTQLPNISSKNELVKKKRSETHIPRHVGRFFGNIPGVVPVSDLRVKELILEDIRTMCRGSSGR
jgi:mRNA-capping enzyme